MKTLIEMGVLRASVLLLFGTFKDIEEDIPEKFEGVFDNSEKYLVRTAYKVDNESQYPHCVVIHTRSTAISVIAHEAVHAAQRIMEGMGMEANAYSNELCASIVCYICKHAESFFCKYEGNES